MSKTQTNILGLSAYYHDSAAALVRDGQIIAAAEQERFSRKKHDAGFPAAAIDYCLKAGGIDAGDLDHVVFYEKPILKFDRLIETYLSCAPAGFKQFLTAMPEWLREKLYLRKQMDKSFAGKFKGRYSFCEHHISHAASAFFASGFDEAAILSFDGVGEWATASFGAGRANRIELTDELDFPHSLGLLYSAFTYFCGFRVNWGEYKLMGLAPYGEPKYFDLITNELIDLKQDGSLKLNMKYFPFCHADTMTGKNFEQLFPGPARKPESQITQREMDMAASVQAVTEEVLLRAAKHVHKQTGLKNLALAGGVALNCVAGGRLLKEGPFENIWIQPAAGDAGGALGAALYAWFQLLGNERKTSGKDLQSGSLLGPSFSNDEVNTFLDSAGAVYHSLDVADLLDKTSELIEQGKVVGWFQGAMEFGPRALGGRSILADGRNENMLSIINQKIKFRESFRPLAPSVLKEDASEYFDVPQGFHSPYMMLTAFVREDKLLAGVADSTLKGLEKLKAKRSLIPAVTHVDNSARLQTVDEETNPKFYKLLSRFKERTGCPLVINTSFNVRGEPIVCTPEDAWRCFMATGMDALVIENHLLLKTEQLEELEQQRPPAALKHKNFLLSLANINSSPTAKELREFGLAAVVASIVLSILLYLLTDISLKTYAIIIAVGIGAFFFSLISKSVTRRLYIAMQLAASPIGITVNIVLLSIVFFLLITPIGLVLRLFGRDELQRKIDRAAKSYWKKRKAPSPGEPYEIGFFTEFLLYMKESKKWWLLPIFIVLLLLGLVLYISGTSIVPFIYPFF
jgi:carbamoyltransferase